MIVADFKKKVFYLFLEKRKGRKKEEGRHIDVWEKHQLVASYMHPSGGPGPQLRHVTWLGIKPATYALGDDAEPTEPCWSGLTCFLI